MQTKTLYLASAGIAVPVLALALAASAASPNGNQPQAWNGRPQLTEEQQQVLQQARDLRQQGKNDEAKALLENANIPKPPMFAGHSFRHRMNPDARDQRQAIHEAVMNNDYATFQELTKDAPFGDKIDEATFAKLVEAEQLRQQGDLEGARAILDEIFPNRPKKPGLHLGQRFHHPPQTNQQANNS